LTGVEIAAVLTEELQNTCVKRRRKRVLESVESMARKFLSEQSLVTDKWISFDPLDDEIIEKLFKKDIREGEEKLALAVLESAIEDFQKYVLSTDQKERKLFQDAEKWFFGKDSDQLFSFEYICAILGLAPAYVRRGLLAWKEAKLKISSAENQRVDGPKLAKSRVTRRPVRFSKTA
jgi:hypothetical protein